MRRLDVQTGQARNRSHCAHARPDQDDALHQRARGRLHQRIGDRRTPKERLRDRARAAALRLGRRRASRARRPSTARRWRATAEIAVNARSEVRESYAGYRTAYDLAKHYRDEVVPLRKRIADENALRYNGMLIGVFELLADAREQVGSVNAAIEAIRDFWLADTALQLALTGSPGRRDGASAARQRIDRGGTGRRSLRRRRTWIQTQIVPRIGWRRDARCRCREPRGAAALPEAPTMTSVGDPGRRSRRPTAAPTTRSSRSTDGRCPGA